MPPFIKNGTVWGWGTAHARVRVVELSEVEQDAGLGLPHSNTTRERRKPSVF